MMQLEELTLNPALAPTGVFRGHAHAQATHLLRDRRATTTWSTSESALCSSVADLRIRPVRPGDADLVLYGCSPGRAHDLPTNRVDREAFTPQVEDTQGQRSLGQAGERPSPRSGRLWAWRASTSASRGLGSIGSGQRQLAHDRHVGRLHPTPAGSPSPPARATARYRLRTTTINAMAGRGFP